MSVINRLNRLVRANLNDLASRASGRNVMGEVRDSLRDARSQLVECRIAEKRLSTEYETLLDESQSWEDRALLALRSKDEELARRALMRKHEIDRRARDIKDQLNSQREYSTDLRRSLDAMEVKLEALRDRGHARPSGTGPESSSRREPSPPRVERPRRDALSRVEAEVELGGLGRPELFDDFDDMSARLSRTEAELDALQELAGGSGWTEDRDLEARFRKLETDRSLKRLKRKAGQSSDREGDDLSDLKQRLDEE